MSTRLLRRHRLNQSKDFDRLFRKSERSSDGVITVLARRNGSEWSRLGMAISRKCAPRAVDRNRLKRIIRESFRHSRDQLQGLDLVVIGKRKRPLANSRDLAQSLERHWLVVSERCKRC
jgi:ribonuclease P protein component